MSENPGKSASNLAVNQGSILLLFDDVDSEIVRSWRVGRKLECPTIGPADSKVTGRQSNTNCLAWQPPLEHQMNLGDENPT